MKTSSLYLSIFLLIILSSCAVVRPGEVGIKQKFGRLSDNTKTSGMMVYNPFFTKVVKASIQTRNLELTLSLPSKEGLSVRAQISILYRLEQAKVKQVITTYGVNADGIVSSIFRSASADVCAQFFAKDMHSGMRAAIERSIKDKMDTILNNQGILIEAVLLKSIQLPTGLATSIEQRLQAEQDAMRMVFLKQQAERAAEIKIIEATGERDAQKILSEGLTPEILKLKSIEAFRQMAKDSSSKIIITNGSTPFLVQP